MRKTFALFTVLILFVVPVVAHEGEEHVMGTITKIIDESITVESHTDKKMVEVGLGTGTKYMKGEDVASQKDLKVGNRVVVHAKKEGNKLVATIVKIAVDMAPSHKH